RGRATRSRRWFASTARSSATASPARSRGGSRTRSGAPRAADADPPPAMIGQSPRSKDAHRFLAGHGRYVDDLTRPGLVHLGVVRSAHAHARITRVDATAARAIRGVLAAWTAADLPQLAQPLATASSGAHKERPFVVPLLAGARARYVGEPVAAVDAETGVLTVWASIQSPYSQRDVIARVLGLPAERVRVIVPDVGGAFGPKGQVYADEVLVAAAAFRLRRPVKWAEARREHLATVG